jgi:Ca2+-binding RTX toxin-like protein
MANVTAQEQMMLELVNRARMDPTGEAARFGISLNAGLSAGTISTAPKQVLAMNDKLVSASDLHSDWMLDTDTFSHTGDGGSNAGARMKAAGYTFSGNWGWGENISWRGTTGTLDPTASIIEQHKGLFLSAGHRTNILKDSFTEVGIGQELGKFGNYNASMVTQDFARSGSSVYLTGVVYGDTVKNDDFYSVGEGKGGVGVSASGKTDFSSAAGGYELALSAGAQAVTIGGVKAELTLGKTNAKLDLVNDTEVWTDASLKLVSGATEAHLLGVSSANLTGGSANEKLFGNAGANQLAGGAGADRIEGGAGNDILVGGTGKDTLLGGAGNDVFDFNSVAEASATPTASNRDIISDFVRGQDKIDFSTIDANGSLAGDAFTYLAAKGAAFGGQAGQLRWYQESGTKTVVEGDINGDRIADFHVELTGLHTLTAGDFLL